MAAHRRAWHPERGEKEAARIKWGGTGRTAESPGGVPGAVAERVRPPEVPAPAPRGLWPSAYVPTPGPSPASAQGRALQRLPPSVRTLSPSARLTQSLSPPSPSPARRPQGSLNPSGGSCRDVTLVTPSLHPNPNPPSPPRAAVFTCRRSRGLGFPTRGQQWALSGQVGTRVKRVAGGTHRPARVQWPTSHFLPSWEGINSLCSVGWRGALPERLDPRWSGLGQCVSKAAGLGARLG